MQKMTLAALLVLVSGLGCQHFENTSASWLDKPDPSEVTEAPKPRISPGTYLAAGRLLEGQQDIPGAVRQYQKAIEIDPKLPEAYNRLGIAFQKLEQFEQAEDAFLAGIRENPDSAMLRNNLGFCYLNQRDFEAAEGEFRQALKLTPDFERARMNLGIALGRQSRWDESAIEFSRVVPTEVAYYNVAVICVDMREYNRALASLKQAVSINPDYKPAQDQIERVSYLASATRSNLANKMAGHADEEAMNEP